MDHAVPLRDRGVEVRMEFGGTEIAVSCYKQHDGDKLLDAKVLYWQNGLVALWSVLVLLKSAVFVAPLLKRINVIRF